MRPRVLVIDDDDELCTLLTQSLQPKGFEVLSATDGREGIRIAFKAQPDLIILDARIPEMDGWQACERLREMTDTPIIMLTAMAAGSDVVRGFQLGVDDYITKPFDLRELELRIRAVLKRTRTRGERATFYDDGTLKIDLRQQQVFRDGRIVHLTPTEFRLLSCLVCHRNSVVPHKHLLKEVWGPGYLDAVDCLYLYIRYLREKLEENCQEPKYIRTEWGVGYRFAAAGGGDAGGASVEQ
jgi:DNA-binding response OmpR family regulator